METYKLFIASSTPGLPTAIFLYRQLADIARKKYEIELDVDCWWEPGNFEPGASTLENLIEKCKAVDFAMILLTPDDLSQKGEYMHLIPRDNCIYEAGLFTGSLGLNPKRCFVLTACDLRMLPTDLLGLTVIKVPHELVERSEELSAEAKRKLESAADTVAKQVQRIGRYNRDSKEFVQLQPVSDLLNWERLETKKGHLRKNSHVSVTARQPLELKESEFAARIHENMNGKVYYRYYFYADKGAANIMAELVHALIVCGIEAANDGQINKLTLEDTRKVRNNLQTIGKFMRIYLLKHEPPFQMCIHNAEWDRLAKCYVQFPGRLEGGFIQWCEGKDATQLAGSLKRLRKGSKTKEKEGPIFCASSEFDLYDEKNEEATEYRSLLRTAIGEWFSNELFPDELREEIVKFALG